jgi:hypothetical protein
MDPEKRRASAPYLPFDTFIGALNQLKAHGMPNNVNPSAFPSFSGTARTQILSALKFLDLIKEDGTPETELEKLVLETEDRKGNIRKLIETHYDDIVALDLARTTPPQFDAKLSGAKYGVSGDTRKKAKTFFLKAAEFAGFTLSPLLTKRTRGNGTTRKKKNTTIKATVTGQQNGDTTPKQKTDVASDNAGNTRTINLKCGGTLMVSLAVNPLELKGADREFVFKITDLMDDYEKATAELTSEEEA